MILVESGTLSALVAWPGWLVAGVRALRSVFAWFSEHTLLGVPLDWPVRFILIAGLYLFLRIRFSTRIAATLSLGLLLGKEFFDVFAHRDLLLPRSPDWGDAADIASGLVGLAAAFLIDRRHRRVRCKKSNEAFSSSDH